MVTERLTFDPGPDPGLDDLLSATPHTAPEPWVVGLDLSLTRTGIAYCDGTVTVVRTEKLRGMERLAVVLRTVRDALDCYGSDPDLVLVEGYSYGSANQAHQMGELGGLIRYELHRLGLRWATMAPGTLKKYATGDGRAQKTPMVVAARDRLGYTGTDDDEADALWLRAAGCEVLGAPLAAMPKLHWAALKPLYEALGIDRPAEPVRRSASLPLRSYTAVNVPVGERL